MQRPAGGWAPARWTNMLGNDRGQGAACQVAASKSLASDQGLSRVLLSPRGTTCLTPPTPDECQTATAPLTMMPEGTARCSTLAQLPRGRPWASNGGTARSLRSRTREGARSITTFLGERGRLGAWSARAAGATPSLSTSPRPRRGRRRRVQPTAARTSGPTRTPDAALESLRAQERRAYVALARLWKPAMAREVGDPARLDTSQCSALLARLVGRGVVTIEGGTPRQKRYYLSERLYGASLRATPRIR